MQQWRTSAARQNRLLFDAEAIIDLLTDINFNEEDFSRCYEKASNHDQLKECTRFIQNKSRLEALHEAMLTYSCEYRRMDALNKAQVLQEKLADCNGASIPESDFNSIACSLHERICEVNKINGLADEGANKHCFDKIRGEQNLYLFRARVAQVRNEDGVILQTPEDIATAVHIYWSRLYKKSTADVSTMDAYIKSTNTKVGGRSLRPFTLLLNR